MGDPQNLLPITPLGRRNARTLAEEAVEALASPIHSGQLKPGDKLPTESEIMQLLGVSRTVVREAISRLQASGLVETRHGIGTFVCQPPESGVHIPIASVTSVMDALALLEFREVLEVNAARLAARRRSPDQLERMRQALERLLAIAADENSEAQQTIDADYVFHRSIAQATGNPYFEQVLRHLGRAAIPRSRVPMDTQSHWHYLQMLNEDHRQLFAAIEAQDADRAARIVYDHLNRSRNRLERALQAQHTGL